MGPASCSMFRFYSPKFPDANPWEIFRNVTWELHEVVTSLKVETRDPERTIITLLGRDGPEEPLGVARTRSGSDVDTMHQWEMGGVLGKVRYNKSELRVWPKYHRNFGRCYSLEFTKNVTKLQLKDMVLDSSLNIYIYIHHPGQFMSVNSKAKVRMRLDRSCCAHTTAKLEFQKKYLIILFLFYSFRLIFF